MRGATRKVIRIRRKGNISTHTPHAERDSGSVYSFTSALPFLLTRPMRGATIGSGSVINGVFNFYSHASCEARLLLLSAHPDTKQFLLTRLLRGATRKKIPRSSAIRISTHTPLARRDTRERPYIVVCTDFYSHASCEARLIHRQMIIIIREFLLTRLLRGATATYSIRNSRTSYIQEADSKIITKYSIKFNILHDPAIKSRRTCLSFMHHNTFACYSP